MMAGRIIKGLIFLSVTSYLAQSDGKSVAAQTPQPAERYEAGLINEESGTKYLEFRVRSGNKTFIIGRNGRASESDLAGPNRQFKLPVIKGQEVEKVESFVSPSEVIFLYEVLNADDRSVGAVKFDRRKFKKHLWSLELSDSPLGPALLIENELYLTAGTQVARVNTETGAVAWKQLRPAAASDLMRITVLKLEGGNLLIQGSGPPPDLKPIQIRIARSTGDVAG
jgi:hypothetical protein